jgi:phosphatidylglycerol lysyltransferase
VPTRLRQALPAIVGLLLLTAALLVLRSELRTVSWVQLIGDIRALRFRTLVLALLLTIANYAVLTGYDFLAFATLETRLPAARIATVSFLSYAVSNNIGFAMLSGASVRYRFYTRWGITGEELSRIVLSYSITFWLGLFALGGLSLVLYPPTTLPALSNPVWPMAAGGALIAAVLLYLAATVTRVRPLAVGRLRLPLPSPRIAVGQLLVSCLEWALAGAVLYVLLPSGKVSFLAFLAAFFAAILLGMASHVPGGLGVFEGVLTWLLGPAVPAADLLPALFVYRGIYYLLPFGIALGALLVDEGLQRRTQAARLTMMVGRLSERLVPRLIAVLTFFSGLVLLVSGATPAAPGRLDRLEAWLPLTVIELSHFQGSVVGALLLVLSQGLSRRLDAAFYLACGGLGAGIVFSLLKGLDYEEAILLALVLVALVNARPAFRRRAAFFETRFSPAWVATVLLALGASVWRGFVAVQPVEYSNDLWWQFEIRGETSRFLRGSVGAAVVMLLFGVARLVRQAPHAVVEPTDGELALAEGIIARQSSTQPSLVYLRDKGLLFNDARTAFVMYGVQGRSWVSMGDPIGPPEAVPDLVSQFLARCDDFGGVPVFYEASAAYLHCYADFGLTFVKIGEEARVDLATFQWAGGSNARFRQALRRLEKIGASFRILQPEDVPRVMDQLREVSDEWRAAKAGAEKGFSMGFFDPQYLARFPVAVVEREGRIEAFANLWTSADGVEMSIDLMRYRAGAPRDLMETLIVHLIQWGQTHGVRWFVLGMAPLSGFPASAAPSLWTRVGTFVYRHGEAVFNFQGLRAFKEKFDPAWQPRYVVYPGGMKLPRVLADISALVAGGYRRIFLP